MDIFNLLWSTVLFTSLSTVFTLLISLFGKKKLNTEENELIQKQIGKLDEISKSLKDLNIIVEDQKKNIIKREQIKRELEETNEKLKPIVDANKSAIESVLDLHYYKHRKNIWIERSISFLLGVLSSALVGLVFYYLSVSNTN